MSRVLSQSLFSAQEVATRSWQSYATSGVVHIGGIALLLLVTFPAVKDISKPKESVTLLAPVLPQYKPKVAPPKIVHRLVAPPKEALAKLIPPRKLITPPPVKPPEPKAKPQMLANAPELKLAPTPNTNIPEAKVEAPAPPKPEVKTGVFAREDMAKGPQKTTDLKVGGFGDPNGAPSANTEQAKLQMAKVGGFDMPNGEKPNGGAGRAQTGGVHAAGFGDSATASPSGSGSHGTVRTGGFGSGDPNGIPGGTGTHGTVKTGGFGDSTAGSPSHAAQNRPAAPSTTPVEILYKPKPVYTEEARGMRLEGQVSLEVVFLAGGGVKVVRIVHGLGHGLDESAEQAATQVRFRPATRGGVPVDANATIYITFQLS
ncbi:MAG: TonB-like protein [Bryobacterales bacterium]|nr:TonB-like protein [Bryobacterales bacterium]